MRWVTMWMLVMMVLIALLMAVPAMAADLVPDEVGAVMMIGDNPDAQPVSAMSWEVIQRGDWTAFGSLLGLEQGYTGLGVDAGKANSSIRAGAGYVHEDLWGAYVRVTYGF